MLDTWDKSQVTFQLAEYWNNSSKTIFIIYFQSSDVDKGQSLA